MEPEKRRYSIILAPVYALFSPGFYRDVGARWGLAAFIYLVWILMLCWAVRMVSVHSTIATFIEEDMSGITEQIPPITIQNGKVSADVEQPYFIVHPDTGKTLAIIDTTGETTSLKGTDAVMLLTDSSLIAKENEHQTKTHDLSPVDHFVIDRETVEGWARFAGKWGAVVLYPICLLGSFVYRVVVALIYFVFAMGIAQGVGARLKYGGILAVTVVAMTPALLLKTAFGITGVNVPFGFLVYFAISMIFVAIGLGANRPRDPAEEEMEMMI